jgi:hypothetical protein
MHVREWCPHVAGGVSDIASAAVPEQRGARRSVGGRDSRRRVPLAGRQHVKVDWVRVYQRITTAVIVSEAP